MGKHNEYTRMRHRFDLADTFLDTGRLDRASYRGMVAAAHMLYADEGVAFAGMPAMPVLRSETSGGTPLRRQDAFGRWYFMPVWVRSSLGEMELPCAVINVTGKKRIVETPLTGRRGTVNELISVDSYEVSITAVLIGEKGNYPEEAVKRMRNLYELNESVELISALTDIIFEEDDRVVFEKIEFPSMQGPEDMQIVKISAHTDAAIELIIE